MRSTLNKVTAACTAALLVLVASACSELGGGGAAAASIEEMEPITLQVSESAAPTGGSASALEAWTESVTEQTDGKIKFEINYSSSLLPAEETLAGVRDGIADIAQVTTQGFQERLPVSYWLSQAASALDPGFPLTGIQGTLATTDFAKGNEVLQEEYEENNAIVLRSGASNFSPMICTKKVESLDDAEGLRLRVAGEPVASEAEAIGMEPVVVSGEEMFEALQRGIVDCINASDGGYVYTTFGFTEIAKFVAPVRFSPTTFIGILMNKDVWESLPADAQQIMADSWAEYEEVRLRETLRDFGRFLEDAEKQDVEITDVTEINEELAAYQEGFRADLIESAPSGIEDPQALLDAYLTSIEDSRTAVAGALTTEPVDPGSGLVEAYRTAEQMVAFEKVHQAYADMHSSHVD